MTDSIKNKDTSTEGRDTVPAEGFLSAVDFVTAYEGGELEEEEIIAGFLHLKETGILYQLQGHYQRTAAVLESHGLI